MTTLARIVSAFVVGLLILTGALAVAAAAREDDPTQNRMTVTDQARDQTRQATQNQGRDRTDPDRDQHRVRLQERDCIQDCGDRTREGMQTQECVRAQDRVHAPDPAEDRVHARHRDHIPDRGHAHDQLHARLRDGSCLADDAS